MKIKTSELEGAALDWAVGMATKTNIAFDIWPMTGEVWPYNDDLESMPRRIHPSTNWNQGGPLIEGYGVSIEYDPAMDAPWSAELRQRPSGSGDGPTPLTAAMRAIVASELGDEVDVPEELV